MLDLAVTTTPQPGDRIAGKYIVERVIGVGGMGYVLAAEHTGLRTRVAIKMLHPRAMSLPGATERLVREAQASAALRSEHVARVLDVGSTEAGARFLVMEYLAGHDLRIILRERGALPIAEAVEYLLQIGDAIEEAHSQGIIHRDLKPGNIFVTKRPNGAPLVKVLDFGLAKVLDPLRDSTPEESLTQTGLVVGSPHYMSPEQFRSLRAADTRSDIWALGVIAYELLTGKRPFHGEGMAGTMLSVIEGDPKPVQAFRPELPDALASVVMRCLQKNPDERPPVSDVMDALQALRLSNIDSPSPPGPAAGEPAISEPAPAVEPATSAPAPPVEPATSAPAPAGEAATSAPAPADEPAASAPAPEGEPVTSAPPPADAPPAPQASPDTPLAPSKPALPEQDISSDAAAETPPVPAEPKASAGRWGRRKWLFVSATVDALLVMIVVVRGVAAGPDATAESSGRPAVQACAKEPPGAAITSEITSLPAVEVPLATLAPGSAAPAALWCEIPPGSYTEPPKQAVSAAPTATPAGPTIRAWSAPPTATSHASKSGADPFGRYD